MCLMMDRFRFSFRLWLCCGLCNCMNFLKMVLSWLVGMLMLLF